MIVHLAEATAIKEWAADVPPDAWALAEAFWPGPLTLILPRADHVPDAVTGGAGTVGLRVPAQPLALELLEAFGGGVAAPSANRFGRVSPTTAAHVRADLGADVDLVLDGGPCSVGVESTIVDLSRGVPRVLRLGGLSVEDLSEVLGHPVEVTAVAGGPGRRTDSVGPGRRRAAVPAPGTLPSHYAPEARVEVLAADAVADRAAAAAGEGRKVGLLAPQRIAGLPAGRRRPAARRAARRPTPSASTSASGRPTGGASTSSWPSRRRRAGSAPPSPTASAGPPPPEPSGVPDVSDAR